jgi:hypothetical protein
LKNLTSLFVSTKRAASAASFLLCLILTLVGAAPLLSGWEDGGNQYSHHPDGHAGLQAQYSNALNDARNVAPDKIYKKLTPIVTENGNLIWENDIVGSRILVAVVAGSYAAAYICADPSGCAGNTCKEGGECAYGYDTWVSVVPELKDFFRHSTPSLLRVIQLMGLPPSYATIGSPNEAKYVMELWVYPKDLYRPCPDSAISDFECETDFPTVMFGVVDLNNKVRATEGLPAPVFKTYTAWFNNRARNIYTKTDTSEAYPWTRLGYTYDWSSHDHIGLSEFVLHGAHEDGSKISVGIKSVKTIREYFSQ